MELFKNSGGRLSGPAAFPVLSFESCLDTLLTVIMISGIVWKLRFLGRMRLTRCHNFRGTSLVNTRSAD